MIKEILVGFFTLGFILFLINGVFFIADNFPGIILGIAAIVIVITVLRALQILGQMVLDET